MKIVIIFKKAQILKRFKRKRSYSTGGQNSLMEEKY